MTPFPGGQITNLHRLAPEVVLCLFGIIIMFADPFVSAAKKRGLAWLAVIGAVVALVSVRIVANDPGTAYTDLISADQFSIFLHLVVISAALLVILGSISYLDR